jgi:hypothetical protein
MKQWIARTMAVALACHAAAALAQTAADTIPAPANAARAQIQNYLASVWSRLSDETFLTRGISKGDIGRAKACSVQAIMGDISDDIAEQLIDILSHPPVKKAEFVTHWMVPDLSKDVARRDQINAQLEKICPQIFEQLKAQ